MSPGGVVPNTASINGPGCREIGHGDQHVGRLQIVELVEPAKQAVVQHFKLPRQAVADVNFDSALDRQFVRVGFRAQIENAVLHGGKPARLRVFGEVAGLARGGALGQLVQHVQLRLSLTAPLGKQRMARLPDSRVARRRRAPRTRPSLTTSNQNSRHGFIT